jgi:autotransporter-associated beta strand protein
MSKIRISIVSAFVAGFTFISFPVPPAGAQLLTSIWDNTTGVWSDSARWDVAPVSSNDTVLVFGGTGGYRATNNTGVVPFILNQFIFNGASGTSSNLGTALEFQVASGGAGPRMVLNGAGTLFLLNQITNLTSTLTFSGTGAGTITYSGAIFGNGPLVFNQTGNIVITANNTGYTGSSLTINTGQLRLETASNAAVQPIGGSPTIHLNGGTLALRNTTSSGGTATFGAGLGYDITVGADAGVQYGSNGGSTDLIRMGGFTITNATLRFTNIGNSSRGQLQVRGTNTLYGNPTFLIANDSVGTTLPGSVTLSGVITQGVASTGFTKSGGGSLAILSGNNPLSGTAWVTGGTLILSNINPIGSAILSYSNGAALRLLSANAYTNVSELTVSTTGLGNLTLSASNSWAGGLVFASGTITVTATNGYSGSSSFTVPTTGTLITSVNGGQPFGTGHISVAGTLTVGGAGNFIEVTNFTLLPGSTLNLPSVSSLADRWEDNRTLFLSNSTLRVEGTGTGTGPREVIGDVSFAGGSFVHMTKGTGTGNRNQLNVNSNLVRVGRATLVLSTTNADLSTNATASVNANVLQLAALNAGGTELANTNGMLMLNGVQAPYVVYGTLNDFVRYIADPAGGTGLVSVVYSGTLATSTPTNMINSGSVAVSADTSVWALKAGRLTGFNVTITNHSGGLILAGSDRVEPNLYFGNAEAVIFGGSILAGRVSGNNGLTKFGPGTLVLSNAANDIHGPVTINQGAIQLGAGNGFGNTNLVYIEPFGTLSLLTNRTGQGGVVIGGLSGSGTVTLGGVNRFRTLTLEQNGTNTFAGVIENGISIVKNGSGTQILTGNNTLTGTTTINGGLLQIDGTFASSATDVNIGGTLSGSGTLTGNVTVNDGGTLSPGSSPGILNTGNLLLNSNAYFHVELNGLTAGTEHDQVKVTGTVGLDLANLVVTLGFTPAMDDEFVIILNDGFDPVSGEFFGLPDGAPFLVGTTVFTVDYYGGDGNDVVLTVIPEPGALTLVLVGLAGAALIMRRRR